MNTKKIPFEQLVRSYQPKRLQNFLGALDNPKLDILTVKKEYSTAFSPKTITYSASVLNPVVLSTPDNYLQAEMKYLDDGIEPSFTYNGAVESSLHRLHMLGIDAHDLPRMVNKLSNQRESIKCSSPEQEYVIKERITDEILNLSLLIARLNKDTTSAKSIQTEIYGNSVDESLVTIATHAIAKEISFNKTKGSLTTEQISILKKTRFSQRAIKKAFEAALEILYSRSTVTVPETHRYAVQIGNYSSIDVRDKSPAGPIIGIPLERDVSGLKLLRLIDHEINSHCRQSLNGWLSFEFAGGHLKPNDETLYEGLAIAAEEQLLGTLIGKPRLPNPLPVLNIAKILEGLSFTELFNWNKQMLMSRFNVPERKAGHRAFKYTFRGFRSFKDKAYFEGFMLQKKLEALQKDSLNETGIWSPEGLVAPANFSATKPPIAKKQNNRTIAEQYLYTVLNTELNLNL